MMRKKILFVYPASYDSQGRLIKGKRSFIPSRALPYLAALTPKQYDVRIIDEMIDELDFDEKADLVALSGMLRHIPRAIDIAREFKKRGVPSIIGGVGAFSLRDMVEKSGAFASFVAGEADEAWKDILSDFENGRLKKIYECAAPSDLSGLPYARFDLLNCKKYMGSFFNKNELFIPIETSRGCPHNCRFCLVTRYFGRKMRYRPVEDVVNEIKHYNVKYFLFTDDNIAINPARSEELFRAIKPLNIQWFGQFESAIIENPHLLKLASESGCRNALVGIETIVKDNLISVDKHRSVKYSLKEIVDGFENAGIDLFASLIFGMDNDTPETIKSTIEQSINTGIDVILPWVLTPIPGTPCFDDYKGEDRLLHDNYSMYDFWHNVIKPKKMTPDELDKWYWWGLRRFYSWPSILSRAFKGRQWNLAWFLCSYYFRQQVGMGLHPIAGNS